MTDFPVRVTQAIVRAQIKTILNAWGMPQDAITPTVEVMVETDLRGIDSHGIAMLPLYNQIRRQGKIEMRPNIEVVKDAGVLALIDAGGGLGHAAASQAMTLAIDKAKAQGMAAVGVRNSNHYGAAGAYALMAARAGLIGICMTNAGSRAIVPTRAKEPVFGTNPLAFAAPAGRNDPFVLDMATSTVAIGKIKLAVYAGKQMPDGWVVDGGGDRVTDPTQAFDGHGRLKQEYGVTPLGGLADLSSHKGYGLAAMVEILCSMLTGAPYIGGVEDRLQHQTGHFCFALNPGVLRDSDDFAADIDAMIDHLHGLEPADPELPVLVAGDPEEASYQERLENGIPIPQILFEALADICRETNTEFVISTRLESQPR
jgi:LDH2 family malate/lactate/ureidoglycolate dehydrogenase